MKVLVVAGVFLLLVGVFVLGYVVYLDIKTQEPELCFMCK